MTELATKYVNEYILKKIDALFTFMVGYMSLSFKQLSSNHYNSGFTLLQIFFVPTHGNVT